MQENFFVELAARGLRTPIGTDLILHERTNPEEVMRDSASLGQVVEESARRYRTPLAMPLMDLRIDKADLLAKLDVPASEVDTFHFHEVTEDQVAAVRAKFKEPFAVRNQAHIDSVKYVAEHTDLVPIGMGIGPFSLMTKLLADPITPIAMAGMGMTAGEDAGVAMVERCIEIAQLTVERSLRAQIAAGAKAMLICEPAASIVYLSPKQIAAGADIFERFVMKPNLAIKKLLDSAGVDLIFHDCGELTAMMLEQFSTRIHPAVLSLGSSRKLWEDAAIVASDVVLFGNLPTKNFYSDAALPVERVEELTVDLIHRMRETGHPHILGSECDVLHVPDAANTIRRKVDVMLTCEA